MEEYLHALKVGDWEVRPELNRLRDGEREVHLEPKLMDLLVCLVSERGRVIPPHRLIDQVWHREFVGSSVLSRSVALLRRALGDDAREPRYIETISKRGYRLVAEVEELWESGSEEEAPSPGCGLVIGAAEVPLRPGDNVIGSDPRAVIRIDSPGVAPQHAVIHVGDNGAVLEDLGVPGGTRWRGLPVEELVALSDGDTVRVGPLLMVFRCVRESSRQGWQEALVDGERISRKTRTEKRGRSEEESRKRTLIP